MDVILTGLEEGRSDNQDIHPGVFVHGGVILVEAQLNVLDRQGHLEQFLQLSLATSQYLRYILKQIEVGAYDQAVSTALKTLPQSEEALQVSKKLRDAGHLEDALNLAEKGLVLDGSKHSLGSWLGPIEETQGRRAQALRAYQAAFVSMPSLVLYQTLKTLSESDWEIMKAALMRVFEGDRFADTLVGRLTSSLPFLDQRFPGANWPARTSA